MSQVSQDGTRQGHVVWRMAEVGFYHLDGISHQGENYPKSLRLLCCPLLWCCRIVGKGLPTGLILRGRGVFHLGKNGKLQREVQTSEDSAIIVDGKELEGENDVQILHAYSQALRNAWPRGNRVLGDAHFSERQRAEACHVYRQMLSSLRNKHSLKAAYTRGRLVLTELREGDEGEEDLEEAHELLERALQEDALEGGQDGRNDEVISVLRLTATLR